MEIDMRIFHKVTVAYPVTTDMVSERTFSFSTPDDARMFRGIAEKQGYKIILHSFDHLVSVTDALSEIEQDIVLTNDQLNYEEHFNG
jgi:hypothetical protein